MHTKQLGPFWFTWHWQNLDDDDKRHRAEDAMLKVLRRLGAVSESNWREVSQARIAFADQLRGRLGHGWRNGRAWLTIYRGDPDQQGTKAGLNLHAQWLLLKRQHSIGASLTVGGGDGNDEVLWSIRLPLFGLYVSCDRLPKRFRPRNPWGKPQNGVQKYVPAERELGASYHNGCLWVKLWSDPDEWSSDAPWTDGRSSWRQPTIHVVDLLLGKQRHSAETLETLSGDLQMPEGAYPVSATLERATWKRARWPWPTVVTRARIECHIPIPVPGKGESAWDCEDDAVHGMTLPAPDLQTAGHRLVASVLETRERYGGDNWTPSGGWPVTRP